MSLRRMATIHHLHSRWDVQRGRFARGVFHKSSASEVDELQDKAEVVWYTLHSCRAGFQHFKNLSENISITAHASCHLNFHLTNSLVNASCIRTGLTTDTTTIYMAILHRFIHPNVDFCNLTLKYTLEDADQLQYDSLISFMLQETYCSMN